MIAEGVYAKVCAGIPSEDMPQKRWIDTVKDYVKKRDLNVRQVRRMVQDRGE